MGYYLKAFIGHSRDINCLSESYSKATLVNLDQDISLIPLTDDLFDQINAFNAAESIDGYEYLTETIELNILKAIKMNSIAYVEVTYFGGQGGQMGIIWGNGKRERQIAYGQEAVNIVLQYYGVIAHQNKDEFDTLGLGRHRNTQEWTESGNHTSVD